ncbi:MAG: tetratricopeptide repeat protein [Thermoplasmata archaeon]|nr:MAG: tetratricopeptide repeat protein [Thermoplasmata archaeon]
MQSYGRLKSDLESDFVDREKELEALKGHLEESILGKGRLVFVIGEAGIGKSRLIDELVVYANSKDVMTLKGRCLYEENSEPYLPFIDAFGKYISGRKHDEQGDFGEDTHTSEDYFSMGLVGIAAGSAESQDTMDLPYGTMEDLAPTGLLLMGDEDAEKQSPEIKKINLQQERTRLFEALSQLVIDISENEPLLLILDDLQWADDGSLQLLHYIARNILNSRVMICGAYRPEDIENIRSETYPLSKILRRMRPEKLFSEIRLDRFNEKSTTSMIESLLKKEDIPDAFVRRLYNESEGNPFFIEEVVKSLINEGLIDLEDYAWKMKFDPSKINLPGTSRDVIGRRIDRLDEGTKAILGYASVIGNQFTFEILHRISEKSEEELIDSIDALIAASIIQEDKASKDERYRFDHTQIREVIYKSMNRSRRRLMHKRISYILEELNKKRLDDIVYNLAHHFYEGKDYKKTLIYAIKAGEKATSAFAPEDALSYYNMALEALERFDDNKENKKRRIDLLKRLGSINFNLSEWKSTLEYYNEAIGLCDDIDNDVDKAESLRKIGYTHNRIGNWEKAAKNFEESLEISNDLDDPFGIADAHRGLGYIHWRLGEYDDAMEHYHMCIQVSMEIGDMHTIALAFIELGNVYVETGHIDKAIEYYNKSLTKLKPIGDYGEMARAYHNLGDSYLKLGSYDRAIEFFKKCEEMGKRIGRRDIVGWSLFNRGEAYALKGEADRALECAEKSLDILNTVGDRLGLQGCYKIFGIAFGLKKEWNMAIENFNTCIEMGKDTNVPYFQGEVHYYYGKMFKDKGDKEKAKEELNKALDIFKGLETEEFVLRIEKEMEDL